MKIYIEDKILEFENDKSEIHNILEEIDQLMVNSSKLLSHMLIDDIEVYGDYYDYFLDNIRTIEKVEVVTLTYKELVEDTLGSTFDYIDKTPDKIEKLADDFYKSPDRESWDGLNDLLGGIAWIINTFNSIDQDKRLNDLVLSYENWNLYAKKTFDLQETLKGFEEAIANKDTITIGDVLSYEIVPIFNDMRDRLVDLLKMEVK